jgi:hypothetical protein
MLNMGAMVACDAHKTQADRQHLPEKKRNDQTTLSLSVWQHTQAAAASANQTSQFPVPVILACTVAKPRTWSAMDGSTVMLTP